MTYPKQVVNPHSYDVRYKCGHEYTVTNTYGRMTMDDLAIERRMLCPECQEAERRKPSKALNQERVRG